MKGKEEGAGPAEGREKERHAETEREIWRATLSH